MLRKTFIVLALLLSLLITTGPAFSQMKRRPTPAPTPNLQQLTPEQKKRLETFDLVWQTIKDNYFDQTFNGLNWENIKKEYQPRVLLAKTSFQFHSALQEMINRLNRSHFVIIPPEVINALEKAKDEAKQKADPRSPDDKNGGPDDAKDIFFDDSNSKFGIGIDIRLIKGQLVITEVEPLSAADRAGLKPGFVIDQVNKVEMKDLFLRISVAGAYGRMADKYFPMVVLSEFIDGENETLVKIDYLDEKDLPHSIDIKRERLNGKLVKAVPNFPKQFFSFEAKALDEDTGYVRFNMFAVNAVEGMCRALRDFRGKKTVILDLRGNVGGSIGALMGITSMLIDRPVMLGTQIFKNSRENILVSPQGRMFDGKLIVLIDSMSYSAAEMLAGGLQESGRLTVVGEKSAGEALPSTTLPLPTGGLFIYPFANFQMIDGTSIEGIGVQPDIKVLRERKALLEGKDSQLEAAVAFSKGQLKAAVPHSVVSVEDRAGDPPPPLARPKSNGPMTGPPAAAPTPKIEKKYDEQALKVIDESIAALGGAEALKKLSSYSAAGTVELSRAGTKVEGSVQLIGKSPDKSAEILYIDAVGEIRAIFDGKKYYLRSDLTGNSELESPQQITEFMLEADLQELLKVKELYRQVIYVGEYQRRGKPAILVKGITADGVEIAFAFDKTSKLLLQRTGIYINSSYDDYRNVDGLMMPFWQSHSESMVLKLTDFKLNVPVEDSFFVPKDNCFSVQKTIKEEKTK
jgi:carboxyl-terminal processing protease